MVSWWYPEGQFIRLQRKPPRVFWHVSSASLQTWPAAHSSISANTRSTIKYVVARGSIVTANDVVITRDRGDCVFVRRWPELMLQFTVKRVKYKLPFQLHKVGRTRASIAKLWYHDSRKRTVTFYLVDSHDGINTRTHIGDLWTVIDRFFSPRQKVT